MKMHRKYRPELLVSKDATRPQLVCLHLDTKAKVLVATNGRGMVTVPVDVDNKDVDGPVFIEAMAEARKVQRASMKKEVTWLHVRALHKLLDVGRMLFRRPTDHRYPEWENVKPSFKAKDAGTITFALDPALLLNIANAIDHSSKFVRVTMAVSKKDPTVSDECEPMIVTTDDDEPAVGVMMQVRW